MRNIAHLVDTSVGVTTVLDSGSVDSGGGSDAEREDEGDEECGLHGCG